MLDNGILWIKGSPTEFSTGINDMDKRVNK